MKAVGWFIAMSALLITIPRYVAVLQSIDGTNLTAIGMGILLAGGAAYIFHAWAISKRKKSWRLIVAFAINLAYEPIIITPFVLARLWSEPLPAVMSQQYAVFWSIIVAMAPVVLISGVVLAISFQKDAKDAKDDATAQKPGIQKEQSVVVPDAILTQSDAIPQFASATEAVRYWHEQEPDLTRAQLAVRVQCAPSTVTRALASKNGGSAT